MYRDLLIVKNTNITTDYTKFTDMTGKDFDPALFFLGEDKDSRPCQSPQPSDTCQQSSHFYASGLRVLL
jgi:hypothetical protein